MSNSEIVRLLPLGDISGKLETMNYVDPKDVSEGTASELGAILFTNSSGGVNAGYWECTACTEEMTNYPYDQCCFVIEGTVTITSTKGHVQTFGVGDAFMIPKGFSGSWRMLARYRNLFITIE